MTYPGEHPTTDEPVAKVLALAAQGYSGTAAAQAVGVPVRQAQRWITRARQELTPGNKPLLDKWTRRVDQSLDLLGDALDLIEADETGSLALKNMPNLNMVAGTGTDKLQKEKEHSQPQNLAQLVIVVNAAAPLPEPEIVIEGEIVDAVQES